MNSNHQNCIPATLLEAHAVWYETTFGGLLVIHAKGEVNNACMQLAIHESPLGIWPPAFDLCQYLPKPSGGCATVITKREVCGYFHLEEPPKFIFLTSASGMEKIPVVPNGDCSCPIPLNKSIVLKSENPDERIGYSSWSRQEALDNALFQFQEKGEPVDPFVATEVVREDAFLEWGLPVYAVTLRRIYL